MDQPRQPKQSMEKLPAIQSETNQTKTVILQHDNVFIDLDTWNLEVISHPPEPPYVDPDDYQLFRSMTQGLGDQHFQSYAEVKNQ